MILSFADAGSEDIFNRRGTKAARRVCAASLWAVTRRKLDQLNAAVSLESLRVPPRNGLEAWRGDRAGQHSIRVNQQYRWCFVWTDAGPEQVAIVDYD